MSIRPQHTKSYGQVNSIGYVERGAQWIGNRVFGLQYSTPEERFRLELIEKIGARTLCPAVLYRQFNKMAERPERRQIYEQLGRKEPLGYKDRLLNWIWRSNAQIIERYCEIGQTTAHHKPYLLADRFLQILKKQSNSSECECL